MSKDVEGNKKQPNTLLKSLFVLGVFGAIALLIAFVKPASSEEKKSNNSISRDQVSKICELATLKCYYHDVAEETVEPAAPFRYGLFRFGYKKFWIEYDGIVELGIDADKVDIVGCVISLRFMSSILSRSSSDIPSFWIMLFTCGIPISFAHFRQRPSFLVSPFSIFVTNITAILLWHLEHNCMCVYPFPA